MRRQAIKRVCKKIMRMHTQAKNYDRNWLVGRLAIARLAASMVEEWLLHSQEGETFVTFLRRHQPDPYGRLDVPASLGLAWYEFPHEGLWRRLGDLNTIIRLTRMSAEDREALFTRINMSAIDRIALIGLDL